MYKFQLFFYTLIMSYLNGQNLDKINPILYNADNGNGTYTNPILYSDYSDPDVILVGDKYYMTASSFNCVPGLPILESS